MCNRARGEFEPETLREKFGAKWGPQIPNTSTIELRPRGKAPVIRSAETQRIIGLMQWDVLGGQAPWPMTNVRQLGLPQWKRLASDPAKRCLIPLTEFCEWEQKPTNLGDGKNPIKAERWFKVTDQPIFAVAGFWQQTVKGDGFTMVTCDANELVKPIHPKAMITILKPEDWDTWLHGSYDEAVALQRPYPADLMTVGPPMFPTRRPAAQPSLI